MLRLSLVIRKTTWNKILEYAPEELKAGIKEVLNDPLRLKEIDNLKFDLIDCLQYFKLKFNLTQFMNCTFRISVT